MRAYEIPAQVTSIEWLNRNAWQSSMTFVVANDKKIRLFRLRSEFCSDFRSGADKNQRAYETH